MRALHVGLVLAALAGAAPAQACPRAATCVIGLDVRALAATAPRRPPVLVRPAAPLSTSITAVAPAWTFEPPVRPDPDAMPWIWQAVRDKLHAQMPRYEQRSLTFTLAPVVVTSPSDSVPGLGLAGAF